jgi:hypothetical protein
VKCWWGRRGGRERKGREGKRGDMVGLAVWKRGGEGRMDGDGWMDGYID